MQDEPPTTPNDIGTASDVAALLRVDLDTVYREARLGRLPCIRVGRQWRFNLPEIVRRFQPDGRGSP